MTLIAEHESAIRLAVFVGVLLLMAVLERFLPRKKRTQPISPRWFTNLGLVAVDTVALRLVIPVMALGLAEIAAAKGWGIFNLLAAPVWLEIVISVLLLDMLIYWQHVASHRFAFLWAVHKVHHADRDFDTTTGVRFHPVEIILSMLYKLLCVVIFGPAAVAVFIFEVLLNASALFNHANLALPLWLDKIIRIVVVTPDMHRVHHSIRPAETNSNYGFNLSIWDRMFGSYVAQPSDGHENMTIGLADEQTDAPSSLIWSLMWPLRGLLRYLRNRN